MPKRRANLQAADDEDGPRLTRIRGRTACCACVVLAAPRAGAARARARTFGVTDDAGKYARDGGGSFVATLNDVGFTENRVSVRWDPRNPTTIAAQAVHRPVRAEGPGRRHRDRLRGLPRERATGITGDARRPDAVRRLRRAARADLPAGEGLRRRQRAEPAALLAAAVHARRQPLAAAPPTSRCSPPSYDALKAVNPAINVIGVGLSPRGNDQPVRAEQRLALAGPVPARPRRRVPGERPHGADHGRARVPPVPAPSTDPPRTRLPVAERRPRRTSTGSSRRSGTRSTAPAQPIFAEAGGDRCRKPLRFDIDEVGWQVAPLPAVGGAYTGNENVADADRARRPGDVLRATWSRWPSATRAVRCSASSASSTRPTSPLPGRARARRRHAAPVVRRGQAGDRRRRTATARPRRSTWPHATAVVLPTAAWGKPHAAAAEAHPLELRRRRGRGGGLPRRDLQGRGRRRRCSAGASRPAGRSRCSLAARRDQGDHAPRVKFPKRRLKPGCYVYAIRMTATMNPSRASVLVSKPFRVGTPEEVTDPRVERLGELVVDYSLGLEPGKVLRIDAPQVAAPLAVESTAPRSRPARTRTRRSSSSGCPSCCSPRATRSSSTYVSPIGWREVELVDAIATIWSEANTRSLTRADPERHQRLIAAQRSSSPTAAGSGSSRRRAALVRHALPDARRTRRTREMSLAEYERFVFGACHVEERGPGRALAGRARRSSAPAPSALADVRELRIVGPDTDLHARRRGPHVERRRRPLQHARRRGLHEPGRDGHRGRDPLRLPGALPRARGRRTCGCASRAAASSTPRPRAAREYLDALLDMDDGARRLGEVAFGLNYEIDRFTRNILFDEKIGGTMHVALGSGFQELGGRNESGAALGHDLRPARGRRGLRRRRAHLAGRPLPRDGRSRACLSRLRRLADVLVGYSGGVQPGDLTVIEGSLNVAPLLERGLRRGAAGRRPPGASRCSPELRRRCCSARAATSSSSG